MTPDRPVSIDPDAVLWSAGPADRVGRPLLVVMHGYGSHEGDLFSLAPRLPLSPVIASLRAPIELAPGSHAWFPLAEPGRPDPGAVDAAADAVLAWLDGLEESYGEIGLLGFSQGGAMTLQLLRRAPERFSFAVNLSGFVAGGDAAGDARLTELKPSVFWGRGTLDRIITAEAIERTDAWLAEHADADIRIYEDVAHGITPQELAEVSFFVENAFIGG